MKAEQHKGYVKITQYIFCFTIGSFVGWLYEIAMGFIVWKHYIDRGVLHLPLCPIYGFGAFVIMAFLGKRRSLPVIFLYGVVISTAVELGASYVIEWIAGQQLWNYSHWPLHFFQGRISLPSSIFFWDFQYACDWARVPVDQKMGGKDTRYRCGYAGYDYCGSGCGGCCDNIFGIENGMIAAQCF